MPAMLRLIERHWLGRGPLIPLLACGVTCALAGASDANEQIASIAGEWSRRYLELSRQPEYHYRCTLETTELVRYVERPRSSFAPPRSPR